MSKYLVKSSPQFHRQFENIKRDVERLGSMFSNTGMVVSETQKQTWLDRASSIEGRLEDLIQESLERFEPYEAE